MTLTPEQLQLIQMMQMAQASQNPGPPPPPPEYVKPQLPPPPGPWMRALEGAGAAVSSMPWYPARDFGSGLGQGFVRGLAGSFAGRGIARGKMQERAEQQAEEQNERLETSYKDRMQAWREAQREAGKTHRERQQRAADIEAAKRVLPPELVPFLPGYSAGERVPESVYREGLNEWQLRTRPKEPKEPKEPKPERIPALSFSPIFNQRISQANEIAVYGGTPSERQAAKAALPGLYEAAYGNAIAMSASPEQLDQWREAIMSDATIDSTVKTRLIGRIAMRNKVAR